VLNYSSGGASQQVACLGVTIQGSAEKGGSWWITGEGVSLDISAQDGALEASFFYPVPPTVSEVSLVYKDKTVLKAIPLTWK
jgi:hypothetical protein